MNNSKVHLRILGDVHGKHDQYINLAKEAEYTIQLGDLGFNYSCLHELDPVKHRVLGGNHDNYTKVDDKFIFMQTSHWLGDFGIYEVPNFGPIFFVRGGYSIDWRYRTPNISWFKDEEMSYKKMQEALDLYLQVKPEFVISHECPASIIDYAFGAKMWDGEWLKPSLTAQLLDQMWNAHQPKFHFFGHHHQWWTEEIKGTKFQCVPELGVVDFEKQSS